MWNVKFKLCTEDPFGDGFSQLQQFTSAINVLYCMGSYLYNKKQNKIYDIYEEIVTNEIEKSAKEEARLEIKAGNVNLLMEKL